ncbi:beta strand repeat-containing protein [Dokdonia sp. Asnod3-C12]|uniref:beta strand repeat-containing protein n=1 Tax=Dokdonia sp. Asnod3-C12 TaxID=3160575 RepID=UPI00386B474E
MKKILLSLIFTVLCTLVAYGQTVTVTGANITPDPLDGISLNGEGIGTFTFTENDGVAAPASAFGMPNVTISISLQYVELTDADVAGITGTVLSYFTVSYDAGNNVLVFQQSSEIPASFSGNISMPLTVTQNSTENQSFNGFNVNIAAIDGPTDAPGSTAFFTHTRGVLADVDITDTSFPGDTLDLSVSDADLNEDPSVAETVNVIVKNDITGESEVIILTETGPNTGVFTGTVDTIYGVSAGANNDELINTQVGDTVTIFYNDQLDENGTLTVLTDVDNVLGGITGIVDITDTSIPGDTLDVVVTDGDLNENPSVAETLNVVVVNEETGESEVVTLTETGPDTGVFAGTVDTIYGVVAGVDNDGVFNTQAGDSVTVTYDDELDEVGSNPGPITDTDLVLGGVTGEVTVTDTSIPGDTLDVVVTDNDLNLDVNIIDTVDVVVVNDQTGESEVVTLTETGPDTGVFAGTVDTVFGEMAGTNDDGTLNTQAGNTVTVTYDDELDNTGDNPAPVTDTDNVIGGVTGEVTITETSIPGDTLDIVVTDNDLNQDINNIEAIEVIVVNDETGESELVTLTETGADTGIFEGTVDTVFGDIAGTDNDGIFNTQAGDTVTVTYDDELDTLGNDPTAVSDTDTVIGGVTGKVEITETSIPGDTLNIIVTDNDLNLDITSVDSIDVVVINDQTGETETITLTETGVDTGVFEGTVNTVFGDIAGTDNDGIFNTQAGDTVTVTYDDELDSNGNNPDPITDTDNVLGGVTGVVDITDTSVPGDTLDISVTDNDLNEDITAIETIEVIVINDNTGESEIITLTETGADTGVFEGTVETVSGIIAGTDNDGVFNSQAGDTITVTYDDVLDVTGSNPSPVSDVDTVLGGVTGTVDITNLSIPGDTLDIVVTDNDLNEDPLTIETIEVVIVNDVTGESETITLTETGIDTGVFTGAVDTEYGVTAGTDNDGIFNTQSGDTVTVTYDDEFDAIGSDPDAITDTNTVGNLPDFGPVIFTGTTTVAGDSGNVDFRVFVAEYNDRQSNGTDAVELRIPKNSAFILTYDSSLTTINGAPVSNADWIFDDSSPVLYKFTYVGNGGVFEGLTASIVGINAVYNPSPNTNGIFPIQATVRYFSGGEVNNSNNDDFDYIEYNNN